MRKLIVLGLIVAGLGGLDLAARSYSESKLEERLRAEVSADASVSGNISGFPFIGRLLLWSSVKEVDIRLRNVKEGRITFATVEVDLDGVELDRDKLIDHREVVVTDIDKGRVAVELEPSLLTSLLKVPVAIRDGKVSVTVRGRTLTAPLSISTEGSLTLGPGLVLPIPKTSLVPCAADVEVREDRIRISCEFTDVPPGVAARVTRF